MQYSECGDLAENNVFIDFIKSLSDSGLQRIKNYCIDKEYYEIVSFILKFRKI